MFTGTQVREKCLFRGL